MGHIFRSIYDRLIYNFITPVILLALQLVLKNKKNLILVTLPKARIYGDNTRYFFEHTYYNTPLNTFLLVKDKQLYDRLCKQFPGRVLYSYSYQGLMAVIRAEVIFFTNNQYDIYPYYPTFFNKLVVNLWHGTPLKRVNFLHRKGVKVFKKNMAFCNKLVTSSEFTKYLMATQFRMHPDDIWITGQPRNDVLINRKSELNKEFVFLNSKTILYAPTFRLGNPIEPFFLRLEELDKLYQLLVKNDAYLLIRLHSNELRLFPGAEKIFGSLNDRIKIANVDVFPCVQQLLVYTDILITDYSSLFFDFLLMERPIIFLPYDIEAYEKNRGFNVDYFENTPGPKPSNMAEFLTVLIEYIQEPEKDNVWRKKINEKYNKFTEGSASERIANLISDYLKT